MLHTTNPEVKPVVINRKMVLAALNDPNFVRLLPPFLAVRALVQKVKAEGKTLNDCSGCKARKTASSIYAQFVRVINTLSDPQLQTLKQYLGVGRLMINRRVENTGKLEVKLI